MHGDGISRRGFVVQAAAAAAALEPLAAAAVEKAQAAGASASSRPRRLSVVCVGGHPDDPESGCGGSLARYIALGHRVTNLYLTRGEAGIEGKSHQEAAAIRTAEAETACKILGAKAVFAGQIDGATEIDAARIASFTAMLAAEQPDVVFAHWPIDTHPDHRVASFLTLHACVASARPCSLYFYEVNSGHQTMCFCPTAYVDITATQPIKIALLGAHPSQYGDRIYRDHHAIMDSFRGRELCVAAAEAFVPLARGQHGGHLPGLGDL